MARLVERQGYAFYACGQCGFAYKDEATADRCARHDLEHGMRSPAITKESIAPPDRYYQAVLKFLEEEQKAAKAKAAAAAKAAKEAGAAEGEGAPAAAQAASSAKPPLSPEELEARKQAALAKAAAAKAAKAAQERGGS